jgi:uncharacterized protein (TIRG00374 family)
MPTNRTIATSVARRVLIGLANILMTAAIFGYLFSHVRPGEVMELLRNVHPHSVAMFMALSLATSVARWWRYDLLLRHSGYAAPRGQLFLVVLVRNALSDLLPARLGTLVDVYFFTTRMRIPLSAAASCYSITFLFELIALAPLVLIAAFDLGVATAVLPPSGLLFAGTLLLAVTVGVLLALPWGFGLAAQMAKRMANSERLKTDRLAKFLDETREEIERVRKAGLYGRVLALSILLRLGKYSSLYVFLHALLAPLGYTWVQLPASRVFIGLCAAELAASLPISGIAGFGAYEGAWSLVFQLLGFPPGIAKMTSIAHHLFTQAWGYGLGLSALVVLFCPVWRRREARPVTAALLRPAVFYAQLTVVVLTVAGVLAAVQVLPLPPPTRVRTAPVDSPTSDDLERFAQWRAEFGGDLIFDSTRSGTFGIWRLDTTRGELRCVADSPQHEIYPDPSPDGHWIVYARCLTLARRSPSEIRICRADGSDDRRLADNGTFPTFSPDGRWVYFEQDRTRVMVVPVEGGTPQQVFPGPRGFGGAQIVKPRIAPDGRHVVFISNRGGGRGWQTWVADLHTGEARHLGSGCEPSWFPDGQRIVFVREGDALRERTGIMQRRLDSLAEEVLVDQDAPLGHEYFPSVTPDGLWLLWGACRPGQHEHLDPSSNYQLFARRLPEGPIVRLTFDGWNNRWPKRLPVHSSSSTNMLVTVSTNSSPTP